MKHVALRKLFLKDGTVVKVGDPIPGFEQWSEEDRDAHVKAGMVRILDEKTGKDAPHPTMKKDAAPPAASSGQRKATPIKRKG